MVSATLLSLSLVCCLLACSESSNTEKDLPDILSIGILPDESKTELLKNYTPLFNYLSEVLGVSYEVVFPSDYADLLHKFERGDVDLAYFGGLTFTQANQRYGALPLVMRDIDVYFTSYFITRQALAKNELIDFKNSTFSFGSKLSTSGHLMPRFYLQEKGIKSEEYFKSIQYSGSHDETAFAVQNKSADLGVLNSKILDKMIMDGRLKNEEIHIVWETPPYPDYVWAVQGDLSRPARDKIINAFLALSPANKVHAEILSGVDAGGFLPASVADFEQLRNIAFQTGLLLNGERKP